MNYLAENSLPIWVAGAVLLTMAAVVYSNCAATRSLLAMAAIVAVDAARSWPSVRRNAARGSGADALRNGRRRGSERCAGGTAYIAPGLRRFAATSKT